MTEEHLKHVYGPVPSRRLGLSLGVDIVPLKNCTLDCVYCQLGRTSALTVDRRAFTPIEPVIADVVRALRQRPTPDFVTVSGSGEPTLHSQLGELIDGLRAVTHLPIAIITNATLLWMPDVRSDCAKADLVLPSLDAGDAETFRRVNRPHPGITFEKLVSGLRAFREEYQGQIWLEVFIVKGITDTEDAVRAIADVVDSIKPTRVQLNTAVRPPAESELQPVRPERMEELAALFDPPAEVVADFRSSTVRPGSGQAGSGRPEPVEGQGPHQATRQAARAEVILEMVSRRPCTVEELAAGLALHPNEVVKFVDELRKAGVITEELRSGRRYYLPARKEQ